MTLPIGQRIRLPGHFDVDVTLEKVRPLGNEGSGGYEVWVRLPDGTLEEAVISVDEAYVVVGAMPGGPVRATPVDAQKLALLVESARIRLAYAHDPQFAVSISGIRTLPHQIEAVYQKMLPQPRLRFLLADDPGAGKTIMAGLLLKELQLRQAIERILILCPAPLTIQWQDEMQRWFGESFDIVFAAVDQQQLVNPWSRNSKVIASIDYAKQADVRDRIWQEHWDFVVIDEAHKCAARTKSAGRNRAPERDTTKRYELAEKLTERADHVLLLTATPHHGDEDKFAHFLRLLDPDLFPEPHKLGRQAAAIRKDIFKLGKDCPWALRRLKEDLKDIDGRRLFPDRHARTVAFKLNSEEFALYKAVTAYINQYLGQGPGQTDRRGASAALARTVFQRRLASSAHAIFESMRRRFEKQQALLDELEGLSPSQRAKRLLAIQGRLSDAEQEEDDLDDVSRDQLLNEYTAAAELEQLHEEIAALKELVEQARRVRDQANDSKLTALRKCLQDAQFSELKDGRGKLIVFTEHVSTLRYLRENLEKWGYTTCEIHGGMNPHERRRAQDLFKTQAQVCVATEAAGEGINLQFCHLMINYDMPWNPTRLEQRLGRIHRIGQTRDCYAFNFVATDSEEGDSVIEGRILQCLLDKLEQMKGALEGRVYDVIGEVLSLNDVNLPEMLREAAYDPRRLDEYIEQISSVDPAKLKEYETATGMALARAFVDFSGFKKEELAVEEKRLMPRYVEEQFVSAAKQIGLKVDKRADGLWRVESVPLDLRSERLKAVAKIGKPESRYLKLTFHKEQCEKDQHIDAVLVGPGHPLYAVVDERLLEVLAPLQGSAGVFVEPLATAPYRLHFFEISIRGKDANGRDIPLHGEVVAVREEQGRFELVPAEILLNLAPHPKAPAQIEPADAQAAMDFLKSGRQLELRAQCQQAREGYADLCRDYLRKSFEARIRRAQDRVMEMKARERSESEVGAALRQAEQELRDLERTRSDRMAGLSRLAVARTGPVKHLGTALVIGGAAEEEAQFAELADELDPEIRKRSELAAEDAVIEDLVREGFPRDRIERVGAQKIGFDIRAHRLVDPASGAVEVKRIEVKGRVKGQPVRLTTNEWFKAQQLAETYWLYVLWEPLGKSPRLVRIQNPAAKLDYAKREIAAARFFEFPAEAIDTVGRAGGAA